MLFIGNPLSLLGSLFWKYNILLIYEWRIQFNWINREINNFKTNQSSNKNIQIKYNNKNEYSNKGISKEKDSKPMSLKQQAKGSDSNTPSKQGSKNRTRKKNSLPKEKIDPKQSAGDSKNKITPITGTQKSQHGKEKVKKSEGSSGIAKTMGRKNNGNSKGVSNASIKKVSESVSYQYGINIKSFNQKEKADTMEIPHDKVKVTDRKHNAISVGTSNTNIKKCSEKIFIQDDINMQSKNQKKNERNVKTENSNRSKESGCAQTISKSVSVNSGNNKLTPQNDTCERSVTVKTIPQKKHGNYETKSNDDQFGGQDKSIQKRTNQHKNKINPILQPPSLTNIGANCYLNSAFQGISACDTFVREITTMCHSYKDSGLKLLPVFKQLMDILNGCSRDKMEISKNPIFCNWNKTGHQDSYELLAHVMNMVYNEIRKYKEDVGDIMRRNLESWLKEKLPMRCLIQYTIKCGCGLVSNSPMQSDLALHVTIPDVKDCHLDKLIELYFDKDYIEDYTCDKPDCSGLKAFRTIKLYEPLPHTVCIHLQRTYWDNFQMKKINKKVSFKLELILKSEYLNVGNDKKPPKQALTDNVTSNSNSDTCPSKNLRTESAFGLQNTSVESLQNKSRKRKRNHKGRSSKKRVSEGGAISIVDGSPADCEEEVSLNDKDLNTEVFALEQSRKLKDLTYRLTSVIVHSGTVECGHYVCYKRVGYKWFLANDSMIQAVSIKDVLNCQAYILFYEKETCNE